MLHVAKNRASSPSLCSGRFNSLPQNKQQFRRCECGKMEKDWLVQQFFCAALRLIEKAGSPSFCSKRLLHYLTPHTSAEDFIEICSLPKEKDVLAHPALLFRCRTSKTIASDLGQIRLWG
eukprot:gb/GEZJ01005227.1/.p1 GENE.gb/GEZJ01005227.1/~~gb/GEZJ01005227.1/.p1  ORF type:complete len:120 (+),score=8.17 gb/GEZJ01005227.1/:491-850(+)